MILLLINLFILNSCNLLVKTIKIEVPSGFVGWCYVIPVKDSTVQTSPLMDGKYQLSTNGVLLLPATVFDIRKDHVIKVYDDGVDISKAMRWGGTVQSVNSTDSLKYRYDYISFYIPSMEERKIPDGTEFWLEKTYEYGKLEKRIFDSLLKAGKIVF